MNPSDLAEWPRVLADDDGIRPAGPPDACFYCRRKVGEKHGDKCVCVVRDVTYSVFHGSEEIGTWACAEPFEWDDAQGYFHRNEGTWCTDNAIDTASDELRARLVEIREQQTNGGCLCFAVWFGDRVAGAMFRRSGRNE
jgi:hypothetical protein